MILFTVIVLAIEIFEIISLVKEKKKKEIIVLIGMGIITLAFGFYYLKIPYTKSLAY